MNIKYDKTSKVLKKDSRQERFRKFREALSLSPTELAKALGVSRPTVYSYEKNVEVPRDRLDQLKQLYKLNPDWYAFGNGTMLLFEAPEDTKVPDNDRLTDLLTEVYNYLPPEKRHLVKAIKEEYLLKGSNVAANDEALKLLKELRDKINKPLL